MPNLSAHSGPVYCPGCFRLLLCVVPLTALFNTSPLGVCGLCTGIISHVLSGYTLSSRSHPFLPLLSLKDSCDLRALQDVTVMDAPRERDTHQNEAHRVVIDELHIEGSGSLMVHEWHCMSLWSVQGLCGCSQSDLTPGLRW